MSETLTTTQLTEHFGIKFRPELLLEHGIEPAEKAKNGYRFNESDVPAIAQALCDAIKKKGKEPIDKSVKAPRPKVVKPVKAPAKVEHDPLNDDDDDDDL